MKYAELCDVVGHEAAQRLAEEVGGECVYLPKKPQHMGRKERVLQLSKAGHPSKDIAVATGLTIRRVQQIIKSETN
jgi:DNA-binding CsgD family transcriptional regulator